jgi:hypothetical protein
MKQSRVLEVRLTKTWADPSYLATWLNEAGDESEKERIIFLIEKTKEAIAHQQKRSKRVIKLLRPIQKAIALYHGVPEISAPALFQNRLEFVYMPPLRSKSQEWFAFMVYARLQNEGVLPNLRRCDLNGCSLWYMAKFPHQRFCQPQCKEKHARSTDEFKAHRRKYMKDRYQTLKRLRSHAGR